MTNEEKFKSLVKTYIKRDGINKLMQFLEERSDFFTCPSSTKYHHSIQEGNIIHSMEVWEHLYNDMGGGKYDVETLAIVSLFHDVCKANYYKVDYKNVKDEKGKWEKVPYYTVDDKLPFGHGEKSVYMIREFMKLTLEEAMAIRWHMGAYEGEHCWDTLSKAFEEFNLAMYLHFADMKSNYVKK